MMEKSYILLFLSCQPICMICSRNISITGPEPLSCYLVMISIDVCVHVSLSNMFTLTNITIIGTEPTLSSYLTRIIHFRFSCLLPHHIQDTSCYFCTQQMDLEYNGNDCLDWTLQILGIEKLFLVKVGVFTNFVKLL